MRDIDYEFELHMDESYANHDGTDEFGCAFLWIENLVGCEYNFCLQSGENCSAIYIMEYSHNDENWHTDWSDFSHYEIDFDDVDWRGKLEKVMYDFALENLEEFDNDKDSSYRVDLFSGHEFVQYYCFDRLEDAERLKSAIEESFTYGAYAEISKFLVGVKGGF